MAKIENGVEGKVYSHVDIFPSVASHDVWTTHDTFSVLMHNFFFFFFCFTVNNGQPPSKLNAKGRLLQHSPSEKINRTGKYFV